MSKRQQDLRVKEGDYQGYLCWDPSLVSETVNMDAASPPASTLLAVHHPARIRRRAVGSKTEGELVTEQDVLEHFLDPSRNLMLLPVLGESGTGKSHLVQWLRAHIEETATRRVIYVPRSGTGLRGLIELMLDKMEGQEAEHLRRELARAFGSTDRSRLPGQLLDAIAEEVSYSTDTTGVDAREARRRRGLAERLPPLLRDEVFRRWFLRPSGVMERYVEAVLDEGIRPAEERSGFAFTTDDFPEPDRLDDIDEIGGFAKRMFREITSSPQLQEAAAELVTTALQNAAPRVFGVTGETSLEAVFRETRRILGERDAELVVLIEDLARFQGVDRDLLDALLEPPIQDGRRVLCDLRAAIAVTTGYFERFSETFVTRAHFAGFEFVLDAPYGEGGWSDEDVFAFASRYLNAARLGATELERRHERASSSDREDSSWVGSACEDCPHKEICHGAFGEVDGRGLYPFNRPALRSMAASVFSKGQFDPRSFLGRVLHTTLTAHAAELQNSRFPSSAVREAFPDAPNLPGSVTTEASQFPDRDRRVVLLRYWGGAPDTLIDLDDGIHVAFDLHKIGKAAAVSPEPEAPVEGPAPPEPKPREETFSDRASQWEGGKQLARFDTRRIQDWIFDAVVAAVPWAALGVKPYHELLVARIFRQHSIVIEDALGVERAKTEVMVEILRSDPDVLLYIAQAIDRPGVALPMAVGTRGYSVLREFLDRHTQAVTHAIATTLTNGEGGIINGAAHRLALGSLALGLPGSTIEPLDLARAALDDSSFGSGDWPATPWGSLLRDLADGRRALQELLVDLASTRQGETGKRSAYRVGRVVGVLDRFIADWDPASLPETPDQLHRRLPRVSLRQIRQAIDSELKELTEISGRFRDLLGDEVIERAQLAEEIEGALGRAEHAGYLPANPMEVQRLARKLGDSPVEEWQCLIGRLPGSDSSIGAVMLAIGAIHQLDPARGLRDLEQLDNTLRQSQEAVETRLQGISGGATTDPLGVTISAAQRLESALSPEESK